MMANDRKIRLAKGHKHKILIAASEIVPFAKTGGLADVAGALPKALKALGHDVRCVMPLYSCVDREAYGIKDTGREAWIDIALCGHRAGIMESVIPGTDIPVYFIENPEFFDREEIYRTPYGEYWDNAERFMFFSRAVVEMIKAVDFKPDVIHCNDWHTSLIPVYLKTAYAWDRNVYGNTATVFSIHNIAYQGVFDRSKLSHAGLPDSLYNMHEMEFYGGVNFMKGGAAFSDIVSTVSRRYCEEVKTPEFGYGLDGLLTARGEDFKGVLNGIDYEVWNPAIDKLLPFYYDMDSLEQKEEIKEELLKENGLNYSPAVPVIGMITRLDDQKGLGFVSAIIEEMMKINLQLVILGTGEERYHSMFWHLRERFPDRIGLNLKFDNRMAHLIYAGCDMFLMPSYFEPCGLGQLISLKYGTVPIVRETGGLADTVRHYNFNKKQGNGFTFQGFNPWDLFLAIRVGVDSFKNRNCWRKIMLNGMKENFSWEHAAAEYVLLYEAALHKVQMRNLEEKKEEEQQ